MSIQQAKPVAGVPRPWRGLLVLLAAAGLALVLARHRPTSPAAATDPDGAVVLGCEWLAWTLTGYLLLGLGTAGLAAVASWRSAGTARLDCTLRVVRVALPAPLRPLLVAGLSAGLAATALPAAAAPSHARDPLDWPGVTATSRSAPHSSAGSEPPADPVVVVRRGDTLWGIAAHALGASPAPSRVAASWPHWYARNHAVIGADPGLIRPGERLHAPTDRTHTGGTS